MHEAQTHKHEISNNRRWTWSARARMILSTSREKQDSAEWNPLLETLKVKVAVAGAITGDIHQ